MAVIFDSTLALVVLKEKLIIVQALQLNIAQIIIGWMFSRLSIDFMEGGLRSIPTSAMAALTEFFFAGAKTNIYLLTVDGILRLVHYGNIDVLVRT